MQSLMKILVLLISVIMAIGLAEVGLRLTHFGEARRTDLANFMEFDPLLGWRHKRNCSSEPTTNEYDTTLQYDANGLRGLAPPYRKPQNVSRIVVLGDSFVDGYTVRVHDRLTEVLGARLGSQFEVINLGVAGYSTDQELLLLEQEGWKYQPDLVVLAFYYNDVWGNAISYLPSNLRTKKPLFVMSAGGDLTLTNVPVPYPARTLRDRFRVYDLIVTAVEGNDWLHSLAIKAGMARSELPKDLPPAATWLAWDPEEFPVYRKNETPRFRKAWGLTQAILRRMKQETAERGVRLVVFYVPARIEVSPEEWSNAHLPPDYDPGEVASRLVGICKAEGIPDIEPSDRFRGAAKQGNLYYRYDPHWNAAGHHLAGQILAEYVEKSWPSR